MRYLTKLNKILFFPLLTLAVILTFYKTPLPPLTHIDDKLITDTPKITKIYEDPLVKNFNGTNYKITPLYDIEITGLVVEQYDSENLLDITHKNDPAQSKDLCLTWNDNLTNETYLKAKYSHGEFTCFFNFKDRSGFGKFHQNMFTNTHLIPENQTLKKIIKDAKKGDQVYIKGKLINYAILDENAKEIRTRQTSITFEDRDCEVILVSDFEYIKRQNYFIREAKYISYKILFITALINTILFFV